MRLVFRLKCRRLALTQKHDSARRADQQVPLLCVHRRFERLFMATGVDEMNSTTLEKGAAQRRFFLVTSRIDAAVARRSSSFVVVRCRRDCSSWWSSSLGAGFFLRVRETSGRSVFDLETRGAPVEDGGGARASTAALVLLIAAATSCSLAPDRCHDERLLTQTARRRRRRHQHASDGIWRCSWGMEMAARGAALVFVVSFLYSAASHCSESVDVAVGVEARANGELEVEDGCSRCLLSFWRRAHEW